MRKNARRRLLGLAGALVLVLAGLGLSAGAAAAVPTLVTCTGTESTDLSPGLTNQPSAQQITFSNDYDSCTHVVGLTVTSTTGTSGPVTVTNPSMTCNDLLTTGTGVKTIDWADSQQSQFSYTRTTSLVGGNVVVTRTGSITSGLYSGSLTTEQVVLVGLAGLSQCAQPGGLTELDGTVVLTIVGT